MDVFNTINFGIEFETCFHILNHPYFENKPEDMITADKKILSALKDCFRAKNRNIEWSIREPKDGQEYNKWILTSDDSIDCDNKDYCIVENREYDIEDCKRLIFYPTELITPILQGRFGLRILLMVLSGIIAGSDIVYNMNDSQGLHVNLSHDRMSENFPRLWAYWEPIILQMIPKYRRSTKFAIPVHDRITTDAKNVNELITEKYGSLHYHSPTDFYYDRYEVRLYPGTMEIDHIVYWTILCMIIMEKSIVDFSITNQFHDEKYVNDFFEMVKDDSLKSFFGMLYSIHKEEKWPEYEVEHTNTHIYPTSLRDLPTNIQDSILSMRRKSCVSSFRMEKKEIFEALSNRDLNLLQKLKKKNNTVWKEIEDILPYFRDNDSDFNGLLNMLLTAFPKKVNIILSQKLDYAVENNDSKSLHEIYDKKVLSMPKLARAAIALEDSYVINEFIERAGKTDFSYLFELAVIYNKIPLVEYIFSNRIPVNIDPYFIVSSYNVDMLKVLLSDDDVRPSLDTVYYILKNNLETSLNKDKLKSIFELFYEKNLITPEIIEKLRHLNKYNDILDHYNSKFLYFNL